MFYRETDNRYRPIFGNYKENLESVFNPLSLAGCFCWIDPSQSPIIYSSSPKILQINDLSNNSNNFSQSDSTKQANLGSDNGKAVFISDTNLYYNFNTSAKGSSQTWFFVYKTISGNNNNPQAHRFFVAGDWTQLYYLSYGSSGFYYYANSNDNQTYCHPMSLNSWELLTIKISGLSVLVYKNGILTTTIQQLASSPQYYANTTSFKWGYEIAVQNLAANWGDLIFYQQSMSDQDRQKVENYLINKWSIV